jgi:hypothetical protein
MPTVIAAHLDEPGGNLVEIIVHRNDSDLDLLASRSDSDTGGRTWIARIMHSLDP